MKNLTFAKALIGTLAAAAIASPALAQHREHEREHERERFATPHWVFDDRFHHNHYYPALGYSVGALPPGSVSLVFRGGRFFYHAGVWFQVGGPGYVVVRPPLGVVVPVLPPSYTTVYVGGVPYYYANDVYYASAPGGYVVAQPPMDPSQAMAPAPAAPAPAPGPAASAPGNWYFCESQKNYYPYVTQCAEGWKTVPASPPPGR